MLKFSKKRFLENDQKGKNVAIKHFEKLGYTPVDTPEAYKAYDCIMEHDDGHNIKIEAEVKRVWSGTAFPYGTVDIPYRKAESLADYFVLSNLESNAYGVVKMKVILSSPVIFKNTSLTKNEQFFRLSQDKFDWYTVSA